MATCRHNQRQALHLGYSIMRHLILIQLLTVSPSLLSLTVHAADSEPVGGGAADANPIDHTPVPRNPVAAPDPNAGRHAPPVEPDKPHADGKDHQVHHRPGEWEPPPGQAIYDKEACREDIDRYCPKLKDKRADIAVLLCIEGERKDDDFLTDACQDLMWKAKLDVTRDEKFFSAAQQFCKQELEHHTECQFHAKAQIPPPGAQGQNAALEQGHLVSCLLDFKGNMTEKGRCHQFLSRMEIIMFSDFHFVGRMVQACHDDIERTKCGRIDITRDHPHSQGSTIDCLLKELVSEREKTKGAQGSLAVGCQRELLRIAEHQSDDYHIDRPLFFACRDDRERFCGSVQSGGGRVLSCLLTHRLERDMSEDCAEKLLLKAQLMAQDYRNAHPLVRACSTEIQMYRCVPPSRNPDPNSPYESQRPHIYLSYVLLCIENALHTNRHVNGECQAQVFENRRILMSDYRISPEIVLNCATEIDLYCKSMVEGGGKTIHCLMNAVKMHYSKAQAGGSQQSYGFGAKCYQAISHLAKVADVDDDYRVDIVLDRACGQAIRKLCTNGERSQGEVLGCLMSNVESKEIGSDCEGRLMEVQYFMARDFTLDTALYQACHQEAVAKCHADPNWVSLNHEKPGFDLDPQSAPANVNVGPETVGVIMPCLYRHIFSEDPQDHLTEMCTVEVHRVMQERAVSVQLQPDIEAVCLKDLSSFCSEATGPGQEMNCLQENFDKLQEPCHQKVEQFAELEAKDVKLNRLLYRACKPVLEKHCPEQVEDDIDSEDTMECLVAQQHVPEMTAKCKAYVHHFQILSAKDYRITNKFKKACQADIDRHCSGEHNKAAVIECLANVRFENLMLGRAEKLSDHCNKQLRIEYIEERENVRELDAKFVKVCNVELEKFCADPAEDIMECIREHKKDLGKPCKRYVFKHEAIEAVDQKMDFTLQRACKSEITNLCAGLGKDETLDCLERSLDSPSMKGACKEVVERRMRENAGDIRLQPALHTACIEDIRTYCSKEMENLKSAADQSDAHDEVVGCLRMEYVKMESRIRAKCAHEIMKIIYQAEIDPQLDPPFYKACEKEIGRLCSKQVIQSEGHAGIMECLRAKFYESRVSDSKCGTEMRRRTDEELMDIHVDPGLFEACAADITRFCKDIRSGRGRVINCLVDVTRQTSLELEPKCRGKLEDRKRLWKAIYKDKLPMNFAEFASIVQASPARHNFLMAAGVMLFLIFVFGLCFGRVTKRVRREMKTK